MYETPCMMPFFYGTLPSTYRPLSKALKLIKESIADEREDELFYDWLISAAPTQEEKEIIRSIRNDEQKHNKMFKKIYKYFTGESVTTPADIQLHRPVSYIDGVKKALFGELSAVERYRDIHAGLSVRYFRDMVFRILTDELKHAGKYNYIYALRTGPEIYIHARHPEIPPKAGFTTEEAQEVAKKLGIDFNKEKFDIEQFRIGMDVELEHGRRDPRTDVTGDDPILTGKIALAHLNELPDYYVRLKKLEEEGKAYWQIDSSPIFVFDYTSEK